MLSLNFVHTLAFGGLALFVGYGLCRLIRPLSRYNIPAPVVGGLLVALLLLLTRRDGLSLIKFDTLLQEPLMIAFFTTIGFGASLSLLRIGGPQVLRFFLISTVFAVVQNLLGWLVSLPFGINPLFGVLSGSVTLTGGPATGLAFAPLFEKAGVNGAASFAIAAAMFGIVSGGLIGGPVGTRLIERFRLPTPRPGGAQVENKAAPELIEPLLPEPENNALAGEDKESYSLLKSVVLILSAMWGGYWLSRLFTGIGLTLPAYIGAMFVAAVIRNFDDWTGLLAVSQKTIDDIGNVSLSLFLVMALMTLRLWELAGLMLPLIVMLLAQLAMIALAAYWLVFRLMGRDYEAAVMSGGFIGFMMGTTANAMANMNALVERFGKSPRAYLVVPMVGAFFIDFANGLIITVFLNILG